MAFSRVLGISLGTGKLGVAVMESYSIFDCQMKCFTGEWSPKKLQAIVSVIERYVVDHKIKHIAVKIPTVAVPAPAIAELLEEIKKLTQAKNMILHTYSIAQLKRAWAGSQKMNKKQLMECVLKKYPELQQEYAREMRSKLKYYEKVFEAVSIADRLLQKLS